MDDYFNFWDYGSYIVPPILESPPSRSRQPAPSQAPSYETPYWIDTINRAIERAAQVATLEVAGYPPYPSYPAPTPTSMPVTLPAPVGVTPQQPREGIQLSQTTLMLMVGGVLLFMLGRRR
jgi:hypothetical protein